MQISSTLPFPEGRRLKACLVVLLWVWPMAGAVAEGGPEEVRKAEVGSTGLLDPTRPVEEVRSAEAPGAGPVGSGLLPPGRRMGNGVPLGDVESADGVKPGTRAQPITATTPFAAEPPRGEGPVMMSSDLEPDAAVTPLAPESIPPEAPVVESEDPWEFHVEVTTLYDDNIQLSGRNEEQDFIFLLKASVAWQRGDLRRKRGSWARVFYEATGIGFVENSHEDNVDQEVQAGFQKRWGRFAVGMEGTYLELSGATPDLGDRQQRQDSMVILRGTYDLSGRTFVEANAAWNALRYEEPELADYDEWVAEGFAGYEVSGRTRVAAGGAVGRLDVASMEAQDFQRALVKLTRASTGAMGLTGRAGAEFRQMPRGKTVTPVLSIKADWEPVEDGTKVSAEAFQETVASARLAGENYQRRGVALGLSQPFGSRFSVALAAGYEHLKYSQAADGMASGRSDDYFYATPSLKYEFAARRRAELFYRFREDDSTLEDFSFTSNQWGLSIGLDF